MSRYRCWNWFERLFAIELMKSFVNSSLDTYRTRIPG